MALNGIAVWNLTYPNKWPVRKQHRCLLLTKIPSHSVTCLSLCVRNGSQVEWGWHMLLFSALGRQWQVCLLSLTPVWCTEWVLGQPELLRETPSPNQKPTPLPSPTKIKEIGVSPAHTQQTAVARVVIECCTAQCPFCGTCRHIQPRSGWFAAAGCVHLVSSSPPDCKYCWAITHSALLCVFVCCFWCLDGVKTLVLVFGFHQ